MFAHTRSFFFLSVLMLCNSAAIASVTGQTFNVSVGGNGDTFSPKTLTIQVGDTVTWTNAGGFHNVDATDGSFRNGNPSSSTWTFSHTFTGAGTVNYQCDTHVAMGMTGSITVQAVTPPPPSKNLSATLTGQWYNPAQSGHGFLFEFTNVPDDAIPSQNELVVYWFVYTPDGSGQNWIFAQGPYDTTKSTVTLSATLFQGPKFPFPLSNYDPNAFQGQSWGTLTFAFTDCDNGTASWASTVNGYGNGMIPIQRLTTIQGTACPK